MKIALFFEPHGLFWIILGIGFIFLSLLFSKRFRRTRTKTGKKIYTYPARTTNIDLDKIPPNHILELSDIIGASDLCILQSKPGLVRVGHPLCEDNEPTWIIKIPDNETLPLGYTYEVTDEGKLERIVGLYIST